MKKCDICGNNFRSTVYKDGRKYDLNSRRKVCVECKPIGKYPKKVKKMELSCIYCGKTFFEYQSRMNSSVGHRGKFCSYDCYVNSGGYGKKKRIPKIDTNCSYCNANIQVSLYRIQHSISGKVFCNKSCSTIYKNKFLLKKSIGTRISKTEKYIQEELVEMYPEMEFIFNCTNTINAELDIYIPQLQLAFELNGPTHYEPIYGEKKLIQTQNNDRCKFQACLEKGIEFAIIDISSVKNFKPEKASKFLNMILEIIQERIQVISNQSRSKDEIKKIS